MEFKLIHIKNFRNFEEITVDLSNRNVFIGLNDVGKTNFLYALRFLFDKDVRKNNLLDSDFHKKDIKNPIELCAKIDISDLNSVDNQKLRAKLKGAILSSDKEVYIKLIAEFDQNEMAAIPQLFWGGDPDNLYEMKPRGYLYEIDYIMNVIYIDSYTDLNKLFKKNVGKLIKNENDEDQAVLKEIDDTVTELNNKISSLSGVKEFEQKITPEYRKYRNDKVDISVQSEIAVKGLYSNVIPYIKQEESDDLYPTSGEGRKKLLTYSIYEMIAEESADRKINIFLIDEPENHLHKSMQIALSRIIFGEKRFSYLFVSTHSPYLLYDMDDINIVRVFNETKIDSVSKFYKVPDDFKENRKLLNKGLSEAIFADRVLLVEGPSEEILFDKVLSIVSPDYEVAGGYILAINGIGFNTYFSILEGLSIKTIIKTDNDLRKVDSKNEYSLLGFTRINRYIDVQHHLPTTRISSNTVEAKRSLYLSNQDKLDEIRDKYFIYLSKCDLENDLQEIFGNRLNVNLDTDEIVTYLQGKKHHNMVEFTEKISSDHCLEIYGSYNFACLKELIK